MDVDLTRLRHIVAIARTQSFSRAAEELNITQPALSRSIASFEQRFGLKLFDRSRSGVVPTAMGKLAIAEAEKVLRAARSLDLNLKLYAKGEAGRLAIGMGPLMASLLLPALGKYLLQTRPGFQLRSSIRTPDQLVEELLEDRIEMIFGTSWTIDQMPELAISSIGTIQMRVIVRSGHPLTARQEPGTDDLRHYPVASALDIPSSGLPGEGGAFICDNFHILRDLVLQTDCIWLSSTAFVSTDIAEGRMVSLALRDMEPFESNISLIHRQGRTMSPAAMNVADHVRFLLGTMS